MTSRLDPSTRDKSCIDVICGPLQPLMVTRYACSAIGWIGSGVV